MLKPLIVAGLAALAILSGSALVKEMNALDVQAAATRDAREALERQNIIDLQHQAEACAAREGRIADTYTVRGSYGAYLTFLTCSK